MANKNITYLNKDFNTFRTALIEYAKAYYPTSYNDFSTSSPGSMFIDMASYVGDVLSFYLDNQVQENFLEYAKQTNNLYTLAYMMGYRPKVTSAAITTLDVYQQIPSSGSNYNPDFNYAMIIEAGMQVRSSINNSNYFYCPNRVDFNLSSSIDTTDISVYTTDGNGNPNTYLLKKQTQALSGQVKTINLSFGAAERFPTRTIQDTNIIEILSVYDQTTGFRWYEVPYLAQDFILNPVTNTALLYPQLYQEANEVPYIIERLSVPRRFVSRFNTNDLLELEFGAGIQSTSGSIPNPFNVGIGTVNGIDLLNTAYDPTNFVVNQSYGLAPTNTTLVASYLAGGGAGSNVGTNELTQVVSSNITFPNPVNLTTADSIKGTLATSNAVRAVGGGDGDTADSIRLNTLAKFPSQMRAVTQQDYLGTVLGMPPKFGQVAKAYVTKDTATFSQYLRDEPGERDPLATSIYILGYNTDGTFTVPGLALNKNIQTYLSDYRMLTDTILLKSAYIINIQVGFDVIIRPNYTSREVIAACLVALKAYFARENWQINQPIIMSEIYTLLDQIAGVQTVQKVAIKNIAGTTAGYSQYSYDIPGASLNGVIYPSLDPSIFEVKYPDTDIQGRIVTM
jgi:hypothetical protein